MAEVTKKPHSLAQAGALLLTLLLTLGTLLLPVPASWQGSPEAFHMPLALAAVMMCAYLGAAGLFVSSLSAYKVKLRAAYGFISAGIVLNAIGTVQLAIINAFDLLQTPWVETGGVVLPFLLSGLLLYIGARSFAKLIGVTSVLTNMAIVLPAVVAVSVLASFLPHSPVSTPEIAIDISNGILLWTGLLNLTAAAILLHVHQNIGAHYTNAVAWLFTAFSSSFAVVLIVLLADLVVGDTTGIIDTITNSFTVIVGVLYIQAGYAFRKTKEY